MSAKDINMIEGFFNAKSVVFFKIIFLHITQIFICLVLILMIDGGVKNAKN